MKYFLLNREEVKNDIWVNPQVVKTKSLSKIKKARVLKDKLDKLLTQIQKELKESNIWSKATEEVMNELLFSGKDVEITKQEFDVLYALSLYDTQEQRIKMCNKTEVLKGKLYGKEIKD